VAQVGQHAAAHTCRRAHMFFGGQVQMQEHWVCALAVGGAAAGANALVHCVHMLAHACTCLQGAALTQVLAREGLQPSMLH